MGSRAHVGDGGRAIVEINVIPLVDIILVVLIVFMVAAPLVMKPKIEINLPSSKNSTEDKDKKPMKVTVGKKGELFVDEKPVSLFELAQQSKIRFDSNHDVAALLMADKDTTLETITGVVDAIKEGGIKKLAFSIQKKK